MDFGDFEQLTDLEVQEMISQFVLSIPGNQCRSVFYHYVVGLEKPDEIAERLNITEDEVIDYILEAQERAKNLAQQVGFDITPKPKTIGITFEPEDGDEDGWIEFTMEDLEKWLSEEDKEEDDDEDII